MILKAAYPLVLARGGIEAVMLMFTMMLPNMILFFLINAGTFEGTTLAGQVPSDQLPTIKEILLNQGVSFYLLFSVRNRFFCCFPTTSFKLIRFERGG